MEASAKIIFGNQLRKLSKDDFSLLFVIKELEELIEKHRNENEQWIASHKEKLREERRQLEQEQVLSFFLN